MKFATVNILLFLLAAPALAQTTRPAVVSVRLDELNQLKAEVERLRDEVGRLKKENAKLREAGAKLATDDKIASAIKEGRLAVGMTLDEAESALKSLGRYGDKFLKRESEGRQLYEFKFNGIPPRASGPVYWAWFEDGKIVEWGK